MKWLFLLPFWAFFIFYIMMKVSEEKVVVTEVPRLNNDNQQELGEPVAVVNAEVLPIREKLVTGRQMQQFSGQLRKRVELLPVNSNRSGMSPLWPMGKDPDGLEVLAAGGEFSSWVLFESEELSFYLPEGDALRVEVVEEGELIPMIGALYYRNGKVPLRWYRIVAEGDVTWAAMAIEVADEFDDRLRHPVSESFHRTMEYGGGVARFALDEQGGICRVEWLGNGKRVSLLAWQHSSIHRKAYAALASSVQLRGNLRLPKAKIEGVIRAVTNTARLRLGLLEHGMNAENVQQVLGKPVGISGDVLLYHSRHRQGDFYYRVNLGKDGEFRGLESDWIKPRKDPPIRGSIGWMLEKTEIRAGEPGGIGYDIGALSQQETVFIFDRVNQLVSTVGGKQWNGVCRILENLADMGLKDEEVLNLFRVRFLEEETEIRPAIPVLWRCNPAGCRNIFMQKAKDVISGFRWQSSVLRPASQTVEDLRLLLDFIGESHPGSVELLKLMAQHPSMRLRELGFSLLPWLKSAELRSLSLKGLTDESDQVRLYCAEAIQSLGCAIPGDGAFLEECLRKERVAGIRENLSLAIAQLREP